MLYNKVTVILLIAKIKTFTWQISLFSNNFFKINNQLLQISIYHMTILYTMLNNLQIKVNDSLIYKRKPASMA